MEVLGILLSIPGAFFLTMIYRFTILQAAPHYPWIRRYLIPVSYFVLGLLALELLALVTIGAKRSQLLVGPLFEIGRAVIFFLGTPALINLIILRDPRRQTWKWYLVGMICAAFAFALVMLQFVVSEQLYGVDGVERPYRS